ncbi:MAG: 50S ribosomal protein L1 [Proteobacteria bacterium]|nr:50S ribosomal protein L1 [Pseudomonadota bacterium]
MSKRGKRYATLTSKVSSAERYTTESAFELIKQLDSAKFDESVDVAVRLGVDPRHADQMVRGACSLPHGTGRGVSVLVFAEGDAAAAATEAGADFVGSKDLIEKIQKESWFGFDKTVATRSMMPKVARIGRVLGPRGLMPNPKIGTVVDDDKISETVLALKRGKIDFRVEKAGIIHASIGRVSMEASQLQDNFCALIATLIRLKPSSAKGIYLRSISVSTTMGPGIRIDSNDAQRSSERF